MATMTVMVTLPRTILTIDLIHSLVNEGKEPSHLCASLFLPGGLADWVSVDGFGF